MSVYDQLYEKMSGELERFKEELKRRPPGEIIDRSYEKVWKEEILMFFEDDNFIGEDDAAKLLSLADPLQDLYKGWQDTDCDYLDHLRDSISETISHVTENPGWFMTEAEKKTEHTAAAVNGKISVGDWVIATPDDEYGYLIGEVIEIVKYGTPEQASEADNGTDNIHVNFYAFDYPPERIAEIETDFSDLYGEPKVFDELPIDDVIMTPEMLIRITELGHDEITRMGNLLANCEAFCKCFTGAVPQNEKQAVLLQRLDKNLADYHESLEGFGNQELIDMASKIAAMSDAHSYFSYRGFEDDELDFLLRFQNPLEVMAEGWLDYSTETYNEMSFAFDNVLRHKQDWLDSNPLIGGVGSSGDTPDNSVEPSEPTNTPPEKPKTLADKLQAAGEKVKAQDTHKNNDMPHKWGERE